MWGLVNPNSENEADDFTVVTTQETCVISYILLEGSVDYNKTILKL